MSAISVVDVLWWIFASLTVGCGLGTVTSRNPIASLIFLVIAFFNLAALYLLLGAQFIAAIQVIVYAGAIMVLFLFVIMLLNLGHDYRSDLRHAGWVIASFVAAGLIGYALSRGFTEPDVIVQRGGGEAIDAAVAELNAVGAIAQPLFRDFLVPFELTSILLLVAIIGAVVLAKRRV